MSSTSEEKDTFFSHHDARSSGIIFNRENNRVALFMIRFQQKTGLQKFGFIAGEYELLIVCQWSAEIYPTSRLLKKSLLWNIMIKKYHIRQL